MALTFVVLGYPPTYRSLILANNSIYPFPMNFLCNMFHPSVMVNRHVAISCTHDIQPKILWQRHVVETHTIPLSKNSKQFNLLFWIEKKNCRRGSCVRLEIVRFPDMTTSVVKWIFIENCGIHKLFMQSKRRKKLCKKNYFI